MSTAFQFTWRTNILQKVYGQVTIDQPFTNFFQQITSGPLTGQYISYEQYILQTLPRGFTQAIYPGLIMIQIQTPEQYTGLITGRLFRKWCPTGPSYILTASQT